MLGPRFFMLRNGDFLFENFIEKTTRGAVNAERGLILNPYKPDLGNTSEGKWNDK